MVPLRPALPGDQQDDRPNAPQQDAEHQGWDDRRVAGHQADDPGQLDVPGPHLPAADQRQQQEDAEPERTTQQRLQRIRGARQQAEQQRYDRGRRQHDVEHAAVFEVNDEHGQKERRVEAGCDQVPGVRGQEPGTRKHTEGAQSEEPGQGERADRRRLQQRCAEGPAFAAMRADAAAEWEPQQGEVVQRGVRSLAA